MVPALLAAAGAIAVGAIIALLVLVNLGVDGLEETLRKTNDRLEATNDRLERTNDRVEPLGETVAPELRRVQPDVRAVRGDVEQVADDLLPSLRSTTRSVAGAVLSLNDEVLAADLPRLTPTVDRAAREGLDLLAEVRRRDLLASADRGAEQLPVMRRTLVQTAASLRSVRRLLIDSRLIQCALLERLRSIDRKTGGEVPPDPGPELAPGTCPEDEALAPPSRSP